MPEEILSAARVEKHRAQQMDGGTVLTPPTATAAMMVPPHCVYALCLGRLQETPPASHSWEAPNIFIPFLSPRQVLGLKNS